MSELNLILLGPPGSGKGTQGETLQVDFRLPYYATGDILRSAVRDGTELGRQAKEYMDRGDLVPDELIVNMIAERIDSAEAADGFILDGFPRTAPQAQALDAMLDAIGKPLDAVLLLEVGDDVALERLLSRRAEEGRNDDSLDVIRNRLRLYHGLTKPVVERYREGGTLVAVNGERPVEDVSAAIEEELSRAVGAPRP